MLLANFVKNEYRSMNRDKKTELWPGSKYVSQKFHVHNKTQKQTKNKTHNQQAVYTPWVWPLTCMSFPPFTSFVLTRQKAEVWKDKRNRYLNTHWRATISSTHSLLALRWCLWPKVIRPSWRSNSYHRKQHDTGLRQHVPFMSGYLKS